MPLEGLYFLVKCFVFPENFHIWLAYFFSSFILRAILLFNSKLTELLGKVVFLKYLLCVGKRSYLLLPCVF